MNTKQAEMGDVVRLLEDSSFDLTVGNLYYIHGTSDSTSGVFASFYDDAGRERAFHDASKYEVVGKLQDMVLAPLPPVKELRDIHAQSVQVGDYVAYNYAVGVLKVFEIVNINGDVADGRCVIMDSIYPNLGVFNERAIKLKDYVK